MTVALIVVNAQTALNLPFTSNFNSKVTKFIVPFRLKYKFVEKEIITG